MFAVPSLHEYVVMKVTFTVSNLTPDHFHIPDHANTREEI